MTSQLTAAGIGRHNGDAAIGVDVGGTKTAIGILDAATLSLLSSATIPTRRTDGGTAVLRDIGAQIGVMTGRAARLSRHVRGVGLAVPEIVDPEGRITSGTVIPQWDQLAVIELLAAPAPVRIESDVRAAALAEAVLGAGQGLSYFIYMTVGTGISYCLVRDGTPVTGIRGGALNIGTSVLADLPDSDHRVPAELVLEETASGAALVRSYVAGGGTATRAQEVLAAARDGVELATSIVQAGARALGTAIALLVNLLDPEAVIVGGGLGSAETDYWTSAVTWARRRVYSDAARSLPIRHAQLGAAAGVIGAGIVGLLTNPPDGTGRCGSPEPRTATQP
ncbi:MAG: ROK family protein [Streptosporangiaceae bacterium]